ncbi:MAG: hypothetical protein FWH56_05940 [Betaproteobacteria bacterium]|nr:hypothetical protein [Betaproteobacteria bacterium]
MKAEDGKIHLTDVADTEQLLLIIQSIPSPNKEQTLWQFQQAEPEKKLKFTLTLPNVTAAENV